MKQFFLIPTCALVAAVTVTSCQREEKSCVELATELTTILKKVNDYESAEAAAPAVKVYMERLSAALGRPVAHGGSALYKSESGELKSALEDLAREIARVRASYPEQMAAAEKAAAKKAAQEAKLKAKEEAQKAREAKKKKKQEEREARWAELDNRDAEKLAAKEAKRLEKERKHKRKALESIARQEAKDAAAIEKYRQKYLAEKQKSSGRE